MMIIERNGELGVHELTGKRPGYDHKYGPNAKPGGGIHGETIYHAAKTKIWHENAMIALVLTVSTNRFPATVPLHVANTAPRAGYYPHLNDLSLHVHKAPPDGQICDWVGTCESIWDTGLVHQHFDGCETDCNAPGWGAWPAVWGDVDRPNRDFWKAMREKVWSFARDASFFPQADEPRELIAARAALASLEIGYREAADKIVSLTKHRDDLIAAYKRAR